MTRFDEDVLSEVMKRLQALDRLQDPELCAALNMESFYDLMIEAGYSHDDAQEAANKRGWQRLQSGLKI